MKTIKLLILTLVLGGFISCKKQAVITPSKIQQSVHITNLVTHTLVIKYSYTPNSTSILNYSGFTLTPNKYGNNEYVQNYPGSLHPLTWNDTINNKIFKDSLQLQPNHFMEIIGGLVVGDTIYSGIGFSEPIQQIQPVIQSWYLDGVFIGSDTNINRSTQQGRVIPIH